MGKFDGVLLASDFDNTMVYTEGALRFNQPLPPLLPQNREALEYFMAEGGHFAISTGRALAAFIKVAGDVPMNTPGIICNGAALYDFQTKEYLDTLFMDEISLRRGQNILDTFPALAVEAYQIGNTITAVHPNEVTKMHEHLTKVGTVEAASLLDVDPPIGKLLFEGQREELTAALQYMAEQGWAEEYEITFSGSTLLELTIKGATKGGMLKRLTARLGVDPKHVYAVGDESNDLSMLKVAAEGFSPANCIQLLRDEGCTIVKDAREGALADVIARLDQRY